MEINMDLNNYLKTFLEVSLFKIERKNQIIEI